MDREKRREKRREEEEEEEKRRKKIKGMEKYGTCMETMILVWIIGLLYGIV